ncbi:hypothetical protein RZN32_30725, partial [Klebsiella pneumoniae]|nr:hypothetical protein [Klebsiella pneumoniae]
TGNGSGDGLLNGAASGNGEHNYGIGNGIADDVSITAPLSIQINLAGNSITLIGDSSSSSVNNSATNTSNTVNDNDTTYNGNGSGGGNGSGDGLLNGIGSGNGEQNYGIGNGIADDAS